MRFTIIIALLASALVMATPVQDTTDVAQVEAVQFLNDFAAEVSMSQDQALELLEQYEAFQAAGQEAEFGRFLGKVLGKVAGKVLPKIGRVAAKVLPKIGKAVLKHGSDVVGTAVDVATNAAGGGEEAPATE